MLSYWDALGSGSVAFLDKLAVGIGTRSTGSTADLRLHDRASACNLSLEAIPDNERKVSGLE